MPKLDDTHTVSRIKKRLDELEQDIEVSAKDFRAVLTQEQHDAYESAWEEQQALRKKRRARTKEEERELGWKSKREVRIEMLKSAMAQARSQSSDVWKKKLRDADIRQARIYFDSVSQARREGKDPQSAANFANNELTRAGLRRMDGQMVRSLSPRDRLIREMEEWIIARERNKLSDEELEQIALAEGVELAVLKGSIERTLAKGAPKTGL
jgi:hypothetical protein